MPWARNLSIIVNMIDTVINKDNIQLRNSGVGGGVGHWEPLATDHPK